MLSVWYNLIKRNIRFSKRIDKQKAYSYTIIIVLEIVNQIENFVLVNQPTNYILKHQRY